MFENNIFNQLNLFFPYKKETKSGPVWEIILRSSHNNYIIQTFLWPLVQFSSVAQSSPTLCNPWTAVRQASLSITNSRSLLKLMAMKSAMPSNHLILWHPLHLLPSIFPSIRVFSNESALLIGWPKHWSFSFSINSSSEYSGLISFRMDWLDLLAVQGTLKSLLQYHSRKASILQHSAFFIVQLSHPYMTTVYPYLFLSTFYLISQICQSRIEVSHHNCSQFILYF